MGGGLFSSLFVTPSLAVAGPAAGPIMAELQRRRVFTVLPLAALTTMLTGVRLLWIASGGFDAAYFGRATGAAYLAAAQLAPTLGGLEPAAHATARARLQALQQQASSSMTAAVGLLVLATLGMALARYL